MRFPTRESVRITVWPVRDRREASAGVMFLLGTTVAIPRAIYERAIHQRGRSVRSRSRTRRDNLLHLRHLRLGLSNDFAFVDRSGNEATFMRWRAHTRTTKTAVR